MRPSSFKAALFLAAFLLTACLSSARASSPQVQPTSPPLRVNATATPLPQRAPLLRIATLGDVTTTNVWALFERMNYWDYATQAAYWPRLYDLSPLSLDIEPAAALSAPPAPECDSATCSATLTLRPNLRWSDGSALTAGDVAFTVNMALQFRLGGDWLNAYDPEVLDYAEALSPNSVRFYFKRQPSVAEWQYGALQGPLVNQAYWQPRIAEAVGLLPEESLWLTISKLDAKSAEMQAQIDALNLSLNSMAPESQQYQQTVKQAKTLQEELNSVNHQRDQALEKYEAQLASARAALYALPNALEPTLGVWIFASRIQGAFENTANLGTGYGDPWFDRVRYSVYPDEEQAVQALLNDEVDLVLTPDGLSFASIAQLGGDAAITVSRAPSRSARFLAFNQAKPYLAEPALRQALACMLDSDALARKLGEQAFPLAAFTLDDFWRADGSSLPCAGLPADARLAEAVRLLKSAGYRWETEPSPPAQGKRLISPSGSVLPRLTLLSVSDEEDALRAQSAEFIVQQAGLLGLDLQAQYTEADAILYAVYGSGSYDLAVLGWRLSAYPGYLCDWFTPADENPFSYNGSRLRSACEAWASASRLEQAQARSAEVQSILMEDLPLIPLYVEARYDAYRNLRYSFIAALDGLGGLYGAPEQAIPTP